MSQKIKVIVAIEVINRSLKKRSFSSLEEEASSQKFARYNFPKDHISACASFFDVKDMQSAASVNRFWKKSIVSTARTSEFSKIERFVHALPEFMEENRNAQIGFYNGFNFSDLSSIQAILGISSEETYSLVKNRLAALDLKRETFAGKNLLETRTFLYEARGKIAAILKDLSEADLDRLDAFTEDRNLPFFFDGIFKLSKIYKKVDEINAIDNEDQRGRELQEISKELFELKDFDKTIEVVNAIPSQPFRIETLQELSSGLASLGYIDKSLELINAVPNTPKKDYIFVNISETLFNRGDWDKALEIISNSISSVNAQSVALRSLSQVLANGKSIDSSSLDKVFSAILASPDTIYKRESLLNISKVFAGRGDLSKSIQAIALISSEELRSAAFLYAFPLFSLKEIVKETSTISSKEFRRSAFQHGLYIFNNFKELLQEIAATSDALKRNALLWDIVRISLVHKQFGRALEAADKILTNRQFRAEVLKIISFELQSAGDSGKALEVINSMHHKRLGKRFFKF